MSDLVKRSFSLAGHRTSIALEPEFWAALDDMARLQGLSVVALVTKIDHARPPSRPLASALRVSVLAFARTQGSLSPS